MSAGEIRQGQIVPIEFTIKDQNSVAVDISLATVKTVRIQKPNNIIVSKTADFVSGGTTGKIQIVTAATDLDYVSSTEDVMYKAQAFVTLSGIEYPSDIYEFHVYPNLPTS